MEYPESAHTPRLNTVWLADRLRTKTNARKSATNSRPATAGRAAVHRASAGTRDAASLVSIVPITRVCESSEDMMAAKTPAARQPASRLPACSWISRMMTGPGAPGATSSRPSAPRTTQGNHTAAMHAG